MNSDKNLDIVLVQRSKSPASPQVLQDIEHFFKKWEIPHRVQICHYKSLHAELSHLAGEYVAILPYELHSPLGDMLKLIQTLTSQPDLDIAFGDRYKKKNNPFLSSQGPRPQLDQLYHPLFQNHLRGLFADPLCDSLALRRKTWQSLSEEQKKEVSQFKWTPYFQRLCLDRNMRSADIPLFDDGLTSPNFPRWTSRWNYFWMSSRF